MALMVLVSVVGALAALLLFAHLSGHVRGLAERVARLEQGRAAAVPRSPVPPPRAAPASAPSPPPRPAANAPPLPASGTGPGAAPVAAPSRAATKTSKTGPAARPPAPAASPFAQLERRLAGGLPVWLGAISLALAGAFLAKYSLDQGLLTPVARVVIGAVFGLALLAAGEGLRRRQRRIASALAAAGVADLYACVLAAGQLYRLISPPLAFVLLAAVTFAAVALSLRQGPLVACVGLLGGFVTPGLIGAAQPRPFVLFTYLALLEGGLLTVARRRAWWILPPFALGAGLLWVALWLVQGARQADVLPLGLFLVSIALLGVISSCRSRGPAAGAGAMVQRLVPVAGSAVGLLLALAMAGVTGEGALGWSFIGVLVAGCFALVLADQRRASAAPSYEPLAWAVPVAVAVRLASWGWSEPSAGFPLARFGVTVALMATLVVVAAVLGMRWGREPDRWAWLAAGSLVTFFVIAERVFAWHQVPAPDGAWGGMALLLAGALGALAVTAGRRWNGPARARALTALLAGAAALAALAVPLELEREWWTIGWAVEAAALAWLWRRVRLDVLAFAAGALAVGVGLRLLLNPMVALYPIGTWPFANWLLYGYGVPIVAVLLAARWIDDRRLRVVADGLRLLAVALGLALVALEVRHLFHGTSLVDGLATTALELASVAIAWLVLAGGLTWLARTVRRPLWLQAAQLVGAAALVLLFLGPLTTKNPLLVAEPVGAWLVLNGLLYLYGLPALLALVLARGWSRSPASPAASPLAGVASLGLLLVLVTLEVRQAFHGTVLAAGALGDAELYAYSAVWVVTATVLLVVGVLRRSDLLRRASLAIMMLAVSKVFLVDAAGLVGLYRVISFLGLGVSLLLLAFVYQRFVFRQAS